MSIVGVQTEHQMTIEELESELGTDVKKVKNCLLLVDVMSFINRFNFSQGLLRLTQITLFIDSERYQMLLMEK